MPMGVTTLDLILLVARADLVTANRFDIAFLIRVAGVNSDLGLRARLQTRRSTARYGPDLAEKHIREPHIHVLMFATVTRPGRHNVAGA